MVQFFITVVYSLDYIQRWILIFLFFFAKRAKRGYVYGTMSSQETKREETWKGKTKSYQVRVFNTCSVFGSDSPNLSISGVQTNATT